MEHLVKTILNLKKERPVCIYGAGQLACKILDLINENGIVDAFAIDKAYQNANIKLQNGIPVVALEDFVDKYKDVDVIIGFEGNWENNLTDDIKKGIHNIYAADFLGYLTCEGGNCITDDYYHEHETWFFELSELLSDDKSREVMSDFINQKRTGVYGKKFDPPETQYFDDSIIGRALRGNEVFVDCGAFRGETVKTFIDCLNKHHIDSYTHIYSFEPDNSNAKIMRSELSSYECVEIVEAGVYKKTGTIHFNSKQGSSSRISETGGDSVNVFALDDYFCEKEAVTFIKMDIEGSELDALHGAEKIIRKHKPKLAICVYHRPEDLVDIPKYLQGLGLDYKFYLRSYSCMGVETVLYAIPE
jgi:FkbM family methyltransferase